VGEVAAVVFAVGDALGDALVRPGRVVVRLVFRQDGAQVELAEDQHAVEELPAQGTGKALADRIHARRLDGGAQDPGAGDPSLREQVPRRVRTVNNKAKENSEERV
jgi:hypothetical protein